MNLTYVSSDADNQHRSSPEGVTSGNLRSALLALLGELRAIDYNFIAPTPASQARVLVRPDRQVGASLTDLLGWSLPCRDDRVPPAIVAALERAGLLERRDDGLLAARVRVSNVFGQLFVHSEQQGKLPAAVCLQANGAADDPALPASLAPLVEELVKLLARRIATSYVQASPGGGEDE